MPDLCEHADTQQYLYKHTPTTMMIMDAIHLRHCGGSSAGYPIRGGSYSG